MALTPGQKKCIETLQEPLAVSAGAGSGKTFTLTRRIVHAISSGAVQDIDEVMAITFTSKAAGEIRSRVKGALRAEGLIDQALRVDDAWISTIHGMCARMLRAHAVELGIDPTFTILGQDVAERLMDEAIDKALYNASLNDTSGRVRALFKEYKPRSTQFSMGTDVSSCVRSLVIKATSHPDGFDSFECGPDGIAPVKVLARMIELAQDILIRARAQKETARSLEFIQVTTDALEQAQALMDSPHVTYDEVLAVFSQFVLPGCGFGNGEYKAYVKECAQAEFSQCAQEALCACAQYHLETMIDIARDAYKLFTERKIQLGVLDNNDLLVHAYRALMFHPDIAQAYENRFKLIMIDEFQDTDQLQVDMIMRLAGPCAQRLCVVGDAQQSIYRFRGADVSVYRKHLDYVRKHNPEGVILLPDNFRSSRDVLAFVDRVFEQRDVFGSSFMSLAPARDEARVKVPYQATDHRVEVQLCVKPSRGCTIDSVQYAAQGIAQRFTELKNAGHAAGDMVVLLGSMTHAGVYASALRDAGFSCVIAGGSVFNQAPEVGVMVTLAQMVSNPRDTEQLFSVMSSDLMRLSADDLIQLATLHTQDGVFKRGIYYGITELYQADMRHELEGISESLRMAIRVIARALYACGREPLSDMLHRFVIDTGYLSRLESCGGEGQAVAGNVLKVIRLCKQFEADGWGSAAHIAEQLSDYIACAKEPPGALSVKGNDSVRIMTVHASKGLEFPIVAIAEMEKSRKSTPAFIAESINAKTYVSLKLSSTIASSSDKSLLKKVSLEGILDEDVSPLDVIESTDSPAEYRAALAEYAIEEQRSESQRLLYVALTRAKEALVISMRTTAHRDYANGIASGLNADIQHALCGPGACFEPGDAHYSYGGSLDAYVRVTDLGYVQEVIRMQGISNENCSSKLYNALDNARPSESASDRDACTNTDQKVDDKALSQPFVYEEYIDTEPIVYDYSDVAEQGPSLHCKELRSPGKRAHVFSYSSLGQEGLEYDDGDERIEVVGAPYTDMVELDIPVVDPLDEDARAWQLIRKNLSDADKATDFGTVFHRLCELSILHRDAYAGALVCPQNERIDALMNALAVSPRYKPRLVRALDVWFNSTLAAKVASFEDVRAEQPFFVSIDCKSVDGATVYMEGEMDVLALHPHDMSHALIVDYKTGGSALESETALKRKHLLQSSCYAYTVLRQGYALVDVVFVRVEQCACGQDGDICEPQYVHYRYTKHDQAELEERIVTLYKE